MSGMIDKFMNMIGVSNQNTAEDYDEEYEDENEVMDEYEDEYEEKYSYDKGPSRARKSFSDIENENPYSSRNIQQTKVIPMNTAVSSSKMVITLPACYEDVEEIGGYLKNKKSVIINLENVSKEDARRVLDFLSGAAFMIEGTIQKVSNLIYLLTPKNVEIQNDMERSQYKQQQKTSFSWLK